MVNQVDKEKILDYIKKMQLPGYPDYALAWLKDLILIGAFDYERKY